MTPEELKEQREIISEELKELIHNTAEVWRYYPNVFRQRLSIKQAAAAAITTGLLITLPYVALGFCGVMYLGVLEL